MAPCFTSTSLAACALVSLCVQVSANNFLKADPTRTRESLLAEEVKQSLFAELAGSFGKRTLDRIQDAIRPTYASISKDEHGNLDRAAVRYVLHRYFVQRHGWYVTGLRPSDGAWNTSSPDAVTKDRVPAYVQDLFEQRLGRHGFGIHELAVFAATLEDLIRDEAVSQLEVAYAALKVSTGQRIPGKVLDVILSGYMMAYITGGNLSSVSRSSFKAQEIVVQEIYPSWPSTKMWLRDMRRSIQHTDTYRRNVFAEGLSFGDAVRVVLEIGHNFGPFQALECHGLKAALLEKEHQSSGRVLLHKFYSTTLGGQWEFAESAGYLRQLGALDRIGRAS